MKTIYVSSNVLLETLVGSLLVFLSPIAPLIFALQAALVLEYVLGAYGWRGKAKDKEVIKIHTFHQFITRTSFYVFTMLILRVMDVAFFNDEPYTSKIFASVICIYHLRCAIENYDYAFGTSHWSTLNKFITKLWK